VLAHESAHAVRFDMGYNRSVIDRELDEAESCVHASFTPVLSTRDRQDPVECTRDHLNKWLEQTDMTVDPSGVVMFGKCEVQTARCVAKEDAPMTAAWTTPGRQQVAVCRACLDEQLRTGGWYIEGAQPFPAPRAP
jgi:hypothetical protein